MKRILIVEDITVTRDWLAGIARADVRGGAND